MSRVLQLIERSSSAGEVWRTLGTWLISSTLSGRRSTTRVGGPCRAGTFCRSRCDRDLPVFGHQSGTRPAARACSLLVYERITGSSWEGALAIDSPEFRSKLADLPILLNSEFITTADSYAGHFLAEQAVTDEPVAWFPRRSLTVGNRGRQRSGAGSPSGGQSVQGLRESNLAAGLVPPGDLAAVWPRGGYRPERIAGSSLRRAAAESGAHREPVRAVAADGDSACAQLRHRDSVTGPAVSRWLAAAGHPFVAGRLPRRQLSSPARQPQRWCWSPDEHWPPRSRLTRATCAPDQSRAPRGSRPAAANDRAKRCRAVAAAVPIHPVLLRPAPTIAERSCLRGTSAERRLSPHRNLCAASALTMQPTLTPHSALISPVSVFRCTADAATVGRCGTYPAMRRDDNPVVVGPGEGPFGVRPDRGADAAEALAFNFIKPSQPIRRQSGARHLGCRLGLRHRAPIGTARFARVGSPRRPARKTSALTPSRLSMTAVEVPVAPTVD